MSRETQRWVAVGIAVVGVAAGELVWRPAGIALTFVGIFLGFKSIGEFNIAASRYVFAIAALLHGFMIWRASDNALLGAAPVIACLLIPPWETTSRRLAYQNAYLAPLALGVEIALASLARPYTSWHFALLPTLFGIAFFASDLMKAMSDIRRRVRALTPKIGEPFPEVVLPARLGEPDFRLSDYRGRHVLFCLLRGDWCPVCHVMIRIIAKDAPILAAHGVKVVAVSPNEGASADEVARLLGVDYTFLIDPKCTVAAAIGAVHANAPEPGRSTNLPALLLVDPAGHLVYVSTATDVTLHDPRRVIGMLPSRTAAVHA
jgi:peroxiredoxin